MTELLWQAWLLLAAAFFFGGVLACSLKRRFYYGPTGKKPDMAISGTPHAPAAGEPRIEVAPRAAAEAERFNRAISGQAVSAGAPAPAAKPQPAVAPAPVVAKGAGPGDDLTRIRSIDANVKKLLNDAGIWKFSELAMLSSADAWALSERIGLRGRIELENWVGQAQILATGGETYYSRRIERGQTVPSFTASPRTAEPAPKSTAQTVASSLPLAFGSTGAEDDLTRIRSIDVALQGKLRGLGVRRFADLAALTAPDIKALNEALGLGGRIEQENWIGQAQILASGGETYYSRRVDRAAPAAAAPAPAPSAAPVPAAAPVAAPAPTPAPAPAPAPVTAASPINVAPPANVAVAAPESAISDVAPLRSVRSELLIGADAARTPRPAGENDDLKRIRGIGVLIEKKLNSLGIVHYEQVANWTGADIERISRILDFKGRIERENWIEQARILATGGQTEFSRRTEA
jgi:predicted flap endonuclease-1-like 5' DNA nuclease